MKDEEKIQIILDMLREIRDTARTGLMPDTFTMTPEQWANYKCNKVAYLTDRAIKTVKKMEFLP